MGSYHPQHTIENSMDIPHPCVDPSHPDFHPVSNWSSKLFFEKTLTNEIHSQTNARDGSSSLSSWTHPNIGNRKDMLRILTPTQHSEKGAHFPYEETCVALFSSQLGGELTGPLEMTTEDTTEGELVLFYMYLLVLREYRVACLCWSILLDTGNLYAMLPLHAFSYKLANNFLFPMLVVV